MRSVRIAAALSLLIAVMASAVGNINAVVVHVVDKTV